MCVFYTFITVPQQCKRTVVLKMDKQVPDSVVIMYLQIIIVDGWSYKMIYFAKYVFA